MSDNQLFDYQSWLKYKEMFNRMDNMRSLVSAEQISSLGYPSFTKRIPTASVRLDPHNNEQVIFEFNPDFYHKLSIESLAFVFMHENLHIVLNHIPRMFKMTGQVPGSKLDTQKARKSWMNANIAVDCIVNNLCKYLGYPATEEVDILLGHPDPEDPTKIKPGLIFADRIGYPNFNAGTTVEDIYHWLMSQPPKEGEGEGGEQSIEWVPMDDHDAWNEMNGPNFDGIAEKIAGSFKEQMTKEIQKRMSEIDKDALKKNQDKGKAKSNSFLDNYKPTAGSNSSSELKEYGKLRNRIQTDILRKIHKKIKSIHYAGEEEIWTRPPKKLIMQYPEIVIPTDWNHEGKDKFHVALLIDCSGSISDPQKEQFIRWARSFPRDKIDYEPAAFDTQIIPLNKWDFYNQNKYPRIPTGGGTDLALPEVYVQTIFMKLKKKRPDLVFVLTDGQDGCGLNTPIDPKFQKDYVWLMTANCGSGMDTMKDYCPGGMFIQTNIQ